MRATDIMIGDWVMSFGAPHKIVGIRTDSFYPYIKTDMSDTWYEEGMEDLLEPIPLTPEILETNGFECTRGGKFAGVFNVADRYECAIKNERGGTEWWIDIQDLGEREETLWMIHIQGHRNVSGYWGYVHELQQALRLAGIKKEIVL